VPLKKLKCGAYLIVRPTASEAAHDDATAKPVALSARAMQALRQHGYARIEVQETPQPRRRRQRR
jgi:hypothetical protein